MWVRLAYLLEGLRLEREVMLPPFTVRQVPDRYFGAEGAAILNEQLRTLGFVTEVPRPIWGAQVGPRHRLAVALTQELEVDDPAAASLVIDDQAARLLDLLTLAYGGAPRIIASVVETNDGSATDWKGLGVRVGGGTWPGSILERLVATSRASIDLTDAEREWTALLAEPRLMLWLSLYRSVVSESRWDARMFRACSLLESVANELLPKSPIAVVDGNGVRLRTYDHREADTGEARGKLYALVSKSLRAVGLDDNLLIASPGEDLWAEVGIWVGVRNTVAHEGTWKPPPLPVSGRPQQKRIADAFEMAGLGDGPDAGSTRYANIVVAGAELVLHTAFRIGPSGLSGALASP